MVKRRVQREDVPGGRIVLDRKILVRAPGIVIRPILAAARIALRDLDQEPAFNLSIDVTRSSVRHVSGSAVQRFDGDVELSQGDFSDRIALKDRVGVRAAVDAGIGCVLVGKKTRMRRI